MDIADLAVFAIPIESSRNFQQNKVADQFSVSLSLPISFLRSGLKAKSRNLTEK